MDLRFVTGNVRFVSVSGSLKAVVTELAKCRFGSVGVQEVRWDKGSAEQCFCLWKQEQKESARDVNYCTLEEHTSR
jgi:hypothetical protein